MDEDIGAITSGQATTPITEAAESKYARSGAQVLISFMRIWDRILGLATRLIGSTTRGTTNRGTAGGRRAKNKLIIGGSLDSILTWVLVGDTNLWELFAVVPGCLTGLLTGVSSNRARALCLH